MEQKRGISITLDGAVVRLPRPPAQPARHTRSPRLLGGHVPGAVGGRCRRDGARQRQGHRAPDAQAVRGVPFARPAGDHLPQQVRPPRPRAARTARRDRASDRAAADAGDVAGRDLGRVPRRHRPHARGSSPASPGPLVARRSLPRRSCRPPTRPHEEGTAWTAAVDECGLLDAVGADVDTNTFLAGIVDPGVRRVGAHQLRCSPRARRRGRPRPAAVAACRHRGRRPSARPRTARRSCSRSRPTWTAPIATGSPSSGSAPDASSAAWC